MQGTEAWQLMDGDRIITLRPQGRFTHPPRQNTRSTNLPKIV